MRAVETVPAAVVDYSSEDEIGPAWGEPYGCCLSDLGCPSDVGVAFREYHGLEAAYEAERRMLKREHDRRWKSFCRRKPRKAFWELRRALSGRALESRHQLPRRLRFQYFGPSESLKAMERP